MKNILLILSLLFLSLNSCKKQTIETGGFFENDVTFNTQKEVDNFAKHKYVGIHGTLGINSQEINDLSGLNTLTVIDNALVISNTNLVNLKGLDSLVSIGKEEISNNQNILIKGNHLLEEVNFPILTSLNGMFNIENNVELLSFKANKLTYLKGALYILNNPKLSFLEVKSVTSWDEVPSYGNVMSIINTGITNLSGFSSLKNWVGNIKLDGNLKLTSVAGLDSLKVINRLDLFNSPLIENFNGFTVPTIGGIGIQNCNSLTSLDGFSVWNSIPTGDSFASIDIRVNDNLVDFCGLNNIFANEEVHLMTLLNGYNPSVEDIENGDCD